MKSLKNNCSLAVEFSLIRENISLLEEPIRQLYVIQSESNPLLWFGILFIDSGLYMGGVVRFTMNIEQSYPDSPCPKIYFRPIPYHPLVNPKTGELDTKNAFPDWNSNTHKLHQLLLFVKRVFCRVDMYIEQIQSLLNEDTSGAFDQSLTELFMDFGNTLRLIRTYENEPDEFKRKVESFKQRCSEQLFERPDLFGDDNNALLFSNWDLELHEPLRQCVLANRFVMKPSVKIASYNRETESVSFVPGSERS